MKQQRHSVQAYLGFITDREGAVTGDPPHGATSGIRYKAVAQESPSVRLVEFTEPTRRTNASVVIPAEIGDPCIITVAIGTEEPVRLTVFEPAYFEEACPK